MAVAAGGLAPLSAQEYHLDRGADRRAVFYSDAPVEDFEGVTDRIDGYLLLHDDFGEGGLSATDETVGELYFEVDLASLDTGIGLRNRHMRENYLETEDFPYARYEADVRRISAAGPESWRAWASGSFTVHGVTRDLDVDCPVRPDGEGYLVECEFTTLLSDHEIEIPKVMFLKLADEIRVRVEFRLQPVSGGEGDHP